MELLELVAVILVILGLLGVLLPMVPATPLIFLGAIVYDYTNQWTSFGAGWLLLLFALMLISLVTDWLLGTAGAKRGGASWLAIFTGIILGIIGLFLFPPIGFVIGSIGGVIGVELLRLRDSRRAVQAGTGWLVGWLLGILMEGGIAVLMVLIMLWQA